MVDIISAIWRKKSFSGGAFVLTGLSVKGGSMRLLGGPLGTKNKENMYPGLPPKGLIDPPFTL